MSKLNVNPTWSFKPGIIFRLFEAVTVIDEDNETLILPDKTLVMTAGYGTFVLMETCVTFRVDELDARIMEFSAELLSG